MTPATATALIIGGVAAAGGEIYAANKASKANTQAAQTQADANTKAAELQTQAANQAAADQLQAAEDALAFTKQVYQTKQGQVSPYIGMGQGALNSLGNWLGVTPVAQSPVSLPAGSNAPALPGATSGSLLGVRVNPVPAGTTGVSSGTPAGAQTPTSPTLSQVTPSPTSTQNLSTSSIGPAQVGAQRYINGQLARWDGTGWSAV